VFEKRNVRIFGLKKGVFEKRNVRIFGLKKGCLRRGM